METVTIRVSQNVAAYCINKFGKEIPEDSSIYKFILSVLRQKHSIDNLKYIESPSMRHKVSCALPIGFKQNHGAFTVECEFIISRYLEKIFNEELHKHVKNYMRIGSDLKSKINEVLQNAEIKKSKRSNIESQIKSSITKAAAIWDFIDYYDLNDGEANFQRLEKKLYDRKKKKICQVKAG